MQRPPIKIESDKLEPEVAAFLDYVEKTGCNFARLAGAHNGRPYFIQIVFDDIAAALTENLIVKQAAEANPNPRLDS